MTPMERKLRNTPRAIALAECSNRNNGQTYGVAIEKGQAVLMRIETEGERNVQTPVAGPVPAFDTAGQIAMIDKYWDANYLIRNDRKAMECVRSVMVHNRIDTSSLTVDECIDKAREISAPCRHKHEKNDAGQNQCTGCGGLA